MSFKGDWSEGRKTKQKCLATHILAQSHRTTSRTRNKWTNECNVQTAHQTEPNTKQQQQTMNLNWNKFKQQEERMRKKIKQKIDKWFLKEFAFISTH